MKPTNVLMCFTKLKQVFSGAGPRNSRLMCKELITMKAQGQVKKGWQWDRVVVCLAEHKQRAAGNPTCRGRSFRAVRGSCECLSSESLRLLSFINKQAKGQEEDKDGHWEQGAMQTLSSAITLVTGRDK